MKKYHKDTITKHAREIGDHLNLDWKKYNFTQFKKGLKAELEHRDVTHGDPIKTAKIVLAHLKEVPDYYTKLAQVERKRS